MLRFSVLLLALCCIALMPALQLPSRLAASRVLNAPIECRSCAPLCMCAEGEAEPAVAEGEPAEAVAEAEPVAEVADAKPQRSRKSKTPLADLEVGSTLEGKIRSVQSYGAFVDLGAVQDGLLHVSEMAETFVKDANEMFKVGDTVSVRIKMVNLEKNQVALTCKDESAERRGGGGRKARPDVSEYADADPTAFVAGKVNSIQSYGAFVTLKEGVDGLVHISAIQEGGVSSVEDVLEVGQEVQVRVISFDKEKRRIGLSMKPFVEGESEGGGGGKGQRRERKPRGGADFEDDTPFQMTDEELQDLGFDYEDTSEEASDFAAAFARAAKGQTSQSQKGKFARVVL